MIQTLIISIGIIIVMVPLIILIALYGNFGAGKKKPVDGLYNSLASQLSLNFTHRDVFENTTLSLDETKKILVYIDNNKETMHRKIPLKNVSGSKIVESGISSITRKNGGGYIFEDRSKDFSLALILRNGTVIHLPIYSARREGMSQRDKLMSMAVIWKRKINTLAGHTALQPG